MKPCGNGPRDVVRGEDRPKAASRSLTGAAVLLPQTGRSCLAQRDRAGKVCYADGAAVRC